MDEGSKSHEHDESTDEVPTMRFGGRSIPMATGGMTAREFRAIAAKALAGKELTAEERKAYEAEKETLEASARNLASGSSSLMQRFEDMKIPAIRAQEVGMPSFSAEAEARTEAKRVRRDQLDALKDIATELQAQRLENAETARSSAVLNWWILGVSAGAAIVGLIALIVTIVK